MIEFDSFDFQWEDHGHERKLVILVKGAPDFSESVKWQMQSQMATEIKRILNGENL